MKNKYFKKQTNLMSLLPINTLQFLLFFCFFTTILFAQTTRTSTGSTDWNSASTWSPSGVPGLLDPIIIRPGDIVTVNSTPASAAASITFNNTAATDSGLSIASGATLTITGGVTLLNSDSLFTNASISGLGTLLCQTLTIGSTSIVNAKNSDPTINTLTLTISNLTVNGNIVLINSDEGGKDASKPNFIISPPCNLSANSIVYTHVGPSNGPDSENFFNLNSGATLNLTAAVPFVIDSNKSLKDYMVDINLNSGSNLNICGATSLPSSLTNSGSGGTTSAVPLVTTNTNLSFNSSITLTSGVGTNVVSTPMDVSMVTITYSTGGTTGATFSGLPPGVTGSWSGGVVTISGTPTTVGTYNYTVTTIAAGLCGTKTSTGTITTYICPTFSLLSTTTSSVNVCVGASSLITVTADTANLPVSSYTVSYNIQGVDQPDAAMTVTTAGIGSFVYTGFTTPGDRTVTITKITSGLCSSVITTNNFDTITIVAVLGAPTALAGSGATCTQITANWNSLSGATYYELDVSTLSDFSSFVSGYNALNVGLVTSYNITGLTSGVPYYYRVRAFNGVCISSSSSTITYATAVLPSNVISSAATLQTCDSFTANWTSTANATSYLLDVSTSNSFSAGNFVGVYNSFDVGNIISLNITGLSPGITYYYRIKAKNGCGISTTFSSTRSRTTLSAVPGTVNSVIESLVSCDRFTANWSAVAGATSYLLDISTSSTFATGFYVGVYNGFDVGNVLSLTITGLPANTQYYYRVKGKNGCGNSSSFSAQQDPKTSNAAPGTITSNNPSFISCDGFTAIWTFNTTAPVPTSYLLDVSTSNLFTSFVVGYNGLDVGNVNSFAISGLPSGTTYYYRIKGKNSCGNSSSFSAVRTAAIPSTLPGTVTSNAANPIFCDSFTANWSAATTATSYLLDVSTSSTFLAGSFVGSFNNLDVGNVTSLSITGLTPNTIYYYRVKAENGCGISVAFSTTRNATTLSLPSTPTISSTGALTFCENDSVTLGATAGGTSYDWYLDGSLISTETTGFLFVTTAGSYTVRLTNASGCQSAASVASVVVVQGLPTATAGGSQSICSNSTATISGATATNGTIAWTENGAGSITSGATSLTPVYTPALGDAGNTVILTMTVTSNNTCAPQIATATYTITINALPSAGITSSDADNSFCSGTSVTFTGSGGTNYDFRVGGISVQNSSSNTYNTSSLTDGQIVDVIVTNASGCVSTSSGITNTIVTAVIITSQPTNQLDCEGSIVSFNVIASGSNLTYVWERKLLTDVSFSTIPVEANVSYPTPDKIRLQNVGSALSPNGTQYRVIVTSNSCSVISSPAILSVNEITNLIGGTNVTQCHGTNYSYTVSTSYPSNVVSYQWKSSVTSGVWNDVVNGTHFSGAQTATLNIINGTPAESAEYRVYITFTSSGADCNVNSTSRNRMITFLPLLTTPVTSIIHPTCSTSTGTITVTVQSANDTYSFDNGITYQANNIKSGLAADNYNIIIKNNQDCVSPTTTSTINSQPITPIQPTLGSVTLPGCNAPGGFTILNYNASYTYTVSPNIGVTVSGNTITTPSGNYSVIATLGFCSSVSSANINIPTLITKTWNGISWSPNVPTSNDIVIIDANYNTTSLNPILNACSLVINSGSKLTVQALTSVNIQNDLTVNGTLDVLDQGSLIMVNDSGIVTNNGTTLVHRFTSLFEKFDYVYWSTPVASTNIPSNFPTWRTNYAFEFKPENYLDTNGDTFDDDRNDWSYASTMSPGKGYIIMTPTNKAMYPSVEEIVFSGKVNNGVVTTPIALSPSTINIDDDFNLVGNPYPSAISADAFITANINSNINTSTNKIIEGTLYFWTHVGDISNTNAGPDGLNFSTNDYAVYTLAGGVGTSGNIKNGGPQESNKPSGYIASGQGFFVEADYAGTLLFNNAMRVGTETKNNQFFKLESNNKKNTAIVKNRIWLNLENSSKMFSQQLIGYFDNATLGYDKGYDGQFSDAGNYINFYSFIDDNAYKIQGRSTFDENDQVRLGYSSTVTGTFTIGIDSSEGVFTNSNQPVLLEDKVTNTVFDLKNGAYTFTTEKGTFNDRFILRYTNKTLGVDEVINDKNIQILYSSNYKTVIVKNNSDSIINSMSLFNAAGQHITHSKIEDGGQKIIHIPIKNTSSGVYIVKVKTTEGEMTKKIIIQ